MVGGIVLDHVCWLRALQKRPPNETPVHTHSFLFPHKISRIFFFTHLYSGCRDMAAQHSSRPSRILSAFLCPKPDHVTVCFPSSYDISNHFAKSSRLSILLEKKKLPPSELPFINGKLQLVVRRLQTDHFYNAYSSEEVLHHEVWVPRLSHMYIGRRHS